MSDIVERLREGRNEPTHIQNVVKILGPTELELEAADRIEALEAMIEELEARDKWLQGFKEFAINLADREDCEQGEFGRGYDCANREFYQALVNFEPLPPAPQQEEE